MRKDSKTTAAAIARLMLAAVLPLVMLAACTDTYPNIVSNDGSGIGNDETYDRTPIMLYVNEPNYFSIIATRGTGELTVDKPEKYYNSVVHVFAFRDGPDAQGVFSGNALHPPGAIRRPPHRLPARRPRLQPGNANDVQPGRKRNDRDAGA